MATPSEEALKKQIQPILEQLTASIARERPKNVVRTLPPL
jgi:hypothetical protein